jgi:integrase
MGHYCASAMLERGMSSKRVASWLGHTHKNASGPFSSPN